MGNFFLETWETKQETFKYEISFETTETKQEIFRNNGNKRGDFLETFFRNNGNKTKQVTFK
jgi:hypothetical protein